MTSASPPLPPPDPVTISAPERGPAVEPDRRCILVVEDEWLVRDIIARELEDAGYAVLEAVTGEEGLARLHEEARIDLLFTDIRLPGSIDGWTLAEKARDLRPDLPVIYATGYSEEWPRRVRDSLFFAKPYRPSTVIDAARRLGVAPPSGS